MVLLEQMKRAQCLESALVKTIDTVEVTGMTRTSGSALLWAAVANSPAARSCSSLAATGFDLRVSNNAFRACV